MPKAPKKKRWLRLVATRVRDWLEEPDSWRSAGGVVVNGKGAIALIRQKKKWTFPKGRVDPGETINQAARREVYEEAGLTARITAYLGVLEGNRHDTHYFLMALVKDDGVHDDEADEVRFVKPSEAKQLLQSRKDRALLKRARECLKGSDPQTLRIKR